MINANFFIKEPVNFKKIGSVYPPSIKQILNTELFGIFKKILTLSQEEIEDEFVEEKRSGDFLTPLEYLLNMAYNSKEMELLTKQAFLFFIKEPVHFLYEQKKIVVGDLAESIKNIQSLEELRIIDENNYFDFQNLIRESIGEKLLAPPNPDEDPRIKRMKAKARYRDKIKAEKGNNLKLSSTLASICCMGFGLNPLNIGEISYASVPLLIRFYQEKEKYETDIKSLLAGADSKKIKPKYWINNIED